MRKKILRMLIIVTILYLVLLSPVVQAQSSYLYSVRAQKTPDGNGLADYSDAVNVKISNMIIKGLYLKNTDSHLYIAFRVAKNTSFFGLAVLFDVDHDLKYAEDVKILFANSTTNDGYFYLNSGYSKQAQSYFSGSVNNITYVDGKTYDFYQFAIPFNPNSSPTTDMYIPDPTDYMLGFDFVEILNGSLVSWTRGNLGASNTINKLPGDASSFFTMILAGPGKYAVPDFNPVTAPQLSNSTAVASSSAGTAINQDVRSTGATPGFEFIFPLIVFVMVVAVKKIKDRRLGK